MMAGLPGAVLGAALGLLLGLCALAQPAAAADPIRLKIIGGLADVSQYVRFEEPFWRRRVAELTNGRVQGEIAAFDRAGFRAQEMLALMRLGVVPFGTALLAIVSTEEPEFNAIDLPVLNPDMARLRRSVGLYRPYLEEVLLERYNIVLLAVYTYPAQVTWCTRPFTTLSDLAGRRIRISSAGQGDLVTALGARPVVTSFAAIVPAIRSGVVDCAITGTLSGNAIGLHEVTSHVHSLAINWGVSVFGANKAAWEALPQDIRASLRGGLARLEQEIWEAADRETGDGLACNAGLPTCIAGRKGNMTVVPVAPADESRIRSLLVDTVLPRWVERCGPACTQAWNTRLAPTLGIRAPAD
jgi:TRAP-type C4-dicarboxylate transport system substrate-binding protein